MIKLRLLSVLGGSFLDHAIHAILDLFRNLMKIARTHAICLPSISDIESNVVRYGQCCSKINAHRISNGFDVLTKLDLLVHLVGVSSFFSGNE